MDAYASAPTVLPSLLLCDFGHLADEIARLEAAGARALHLDVMDGHFVPNLSYGLPMVETVRRLTSLPVETHLMISNPGEYVDRYIDAGADAVIVHVEAAADPRPVLERIREHGARAGLAINPPTPLAAIEPALSACDQVLVMSVMPGFGGQTFEAVALDKLRALSGACPATCCWRSMAASTKPRSAAAPRRAPRCSWSARPSFTRTIIPRPFAN